MHRLTKQRLEEFLSHPGMRLPADLEQHLAACEECRRGLRCFGEQSRWLQPLRVPAEVEPTPGFYARVLGRIEAQQRASVWSAFLEPAFWRRLVMATLALLLVLGSLLAFREVEGVYAAPPEALVAIEDHPAALGADPERDRQTILVTLASYKE
jgi:predicted anti-sigma-YlaC factor YlaD